MKEWRTKLLATPVPESFRLGRSIFPDFTQVRNLVDLIGPESHTLFRALNINNNWLNLPIDKWNSDTDFCTTEFFVCSVNVVNDAAERGIKLMTDFATCITKDPVQRAALLSAIATYIRTLRGKRLMLQLDNTLFLLLK